MPPPTPSPLLRPVRRAAALLLTIVVAAASHAATVERARDTPRARFGTVKPARDVIALVDAVVRSGDHEAGPFVVLDKAKARVYVFDASGRLRAHSPMLLGLARGDDTVPGIGERPIADILPQERTTPAGRFVAEMGHSSSRGEDVVWIDYDAAVSMHRVVTTNLKERRLQRLATPSPRDNRISYGCVNLPRAFYERWIAPTVSRERTVVYVLPETRPLAEVFPFLLPAPRTSLAAGGRGQRTASADAASLRAGPRDGPMPLIDQ